MMKTSRYDIDPIYRARLDRYWEKRIAQEQGRLRQGWDRFGIDDRGTSCPYFDDYELRELVRDLDGCGIDYDETWRQIQGDEPCEYLDDGECRNPESEHYNGLCYFFD